MRNYLIITSSTVFVSVLPFILFTDDPSEPLLQRVAGVGSEDEEGESEGGGGGGGRLAQYYIKILRLFEQVPAPSLVIAVADEATKRVSRDDPNCVSGCMSVL